jgi:hypothetical protein
MDPALVAPRPGGRTFTAEAVALGVPRGPGDAGPLTIAGDPAAAWVLDLSGAALATIREVPA